MLQPDTARPAEVFFFTIKPGDRPENCVNAQLAMAWIDTWLNNMRAAFVQGM
jgi:hypothetical protein